MLVMLMPSAKVTVSNDALPLKAELPMLVTEAGMVTDGNELHCPNAFSPMVVTVVGKVIPVSPDL